MDHGSSLLLGIDGLVVDSVLLDESGRRVVHCSTDPELAGSCAVCRQQSSSPKDRVVTRPRDIRIGPDRPEPLWHKRKWHCRVPECERRVLTDELPEEMPAAGTDHHPGPAAQSIGDHLRPVSSVADELGMDWRTAHAAFVTHRAAAREVREQQQRDTTERREQAELAVADRRVDREAGGHRDGNFDRLVQRVPLWVVPA